jgi:hypothetical protein
MYETDKQALYFFRWLRRDAKCLAALAGAVTRRERGLGAQSEK